MSIEPGSRRTNPLLQLRSSFLVTIGAFFLVSVVLRNALPLAVAMVVALLLIAGAFYVQLRDPRAAQLWHWRTRITFATLMASYLALATFLPEDLPVAGQVAFIVASLAVLGGVSYLAIRAKKRDADETALSRSVALTGAGLILVGLLSWAQGG
jgi:peptidoglycan/LPS O-acetylase OafA/YrhL